MAAVYHDLYSEQHRDFILADLARLIAHVGLPTHVKQTITAIYNGHGFESLPGFIEVLRKESKDGETELGFRIEDIVLREIRSLVDPLESLKWLFIVS